MLIQIDQLSRHRNLDDSTWLTKENLQNIIIEDITDKHYENFVSMMERLLNHPYSYQCKDFIMKYRQTLHNQSREREVIEPKIGEDGRQYVTSYGNLEYIVAFIHC